MKIPLTKVSAVAAITIKSTELVRNKLTQYSSISCPIAIPSRWPQQSDIRTRPTRQTWPCPPSTADSSSTTRRSLPSRQSSSHPLTSRPPPARVSHGDPLRRLGILLQLGRSTGLREKGRIDLVNVRFKFPQTKTSFAGHGRERALCLEVRKSLMGPPMSRASAIKSPLEQRRGP